MSSRTAERSETAEGRDRDDIPPNRDYAIDIISYESFREFDLVGRMGVAMLSNLFRVGCAADFRRESRVDIDFASFLFRRL